MPLRKLFPGRRSTAALIIGSMSPDFGYYVNQFPLADFAHTFAGTLLVCLPGGLVALSLCVILRAPLSFLLPHPHRAALAGLFKGQTRLELRSLTVACIAILLGAWTHALWDSFTHESGWVVRHVPFLRKPVFLINGTDLTGWYFLQQASTLASGVALVAMYLLWLRRARLHGVPPGDSSRWRYLVLCCLAAVSLAIAVPQALRVSGHFEGFLAARVFLFRATIGSAAAFGAVYALVALLIYAFRSRRE